MARSIAPGSFQTLLVGRTGPDASGEILLDIIDSYHCDTRHNTHDGR